MEIRPLGQALRCLRRIASHADDGRLDAELVERYVAARDEDAFARLVERHGPLVLGVCRRVLRNPHDAEDAFQATFLVLARQARHIRRRDALTGWLYKVAYHLSVKHRATAERRREVERRTESVRRDAGDGEVLWSDLRTVLDEEIARLPEQYRTPLLLCCLDGCTRDEAAERLGWTPAALKMRLERGRQLLRTRLARRGVPVSAVMLALMLAQQAAANAVPPTLATTTTAAAMQYAAGAAPAALSAKTVALARTGLPGTTGKATLVAAASGLLGVLAVVGVAVLSRTPASVDPAPTENAVDVAARPVVTQRFADVTEASGLGALLRRHHANFPGWHPSGATLLDIDGDDHLDLHLAGQAEGLAALGRNTGGRFSTVDPRSNIPRGVAKRNDLPYPGGQIRLAFDVNEDRALDLAVSWHNNGGSLYYNAAAGGAPRFRRAGFLDDEFPEILACALADVDRDGVVDFLYSCLDTDVAVHLGRRDGTLNSAPATLLQTGLRCSGAIPVDLDGDGVLELIARQSDFDVPARRKILRNTGPLKWTDITRQSGLDENGSVHGVGDLDGDGDPDLVCMEGERIVLHLNDGGGHFTRKPDAVRSLERTTSGPHPGWGDRWGGAVVADFDNDGTADIVINGKFFLFVLRGTGGGNFEYVNDRWGLPDLAHCDVDDGLCFGDVDNDGRLDLVVATSHQNDAKRPVGLFLNQVADHHWLRVRLVGQRGNAGATGAKIRVTEAGRPDRLLASEQISVWGRQSFHSYYAARQTERHFGLGRHAAVDVRVEFYPSGRRVERKNVSADATVLIPERSP